MSEKALPIQGRTRWRRFSVLFVPSLGVVGLLVFLVMNGVLAVSFAISGVPFKLTADKLDGTGFTQIGALNRITACPPDQIYWPSFTATVYGGVAPGSTEMYLTNDGQNIDPGAVITGPNGFSVTATSLGLGTSYYGYLQNPVRKFNITPANVGVANLATVTVGDEGSCVPDATGTQGTQFTSATLLQTAHISNLHQTVCIPVAFLPTLFQYFPWSPLPGAQHWYLLANLRGGSADPNAAQPYATNLLVDAVSLQGANANFDQGINIGETYSTQDSTHASGLLPPSVVQTQGPFANVQGTFSQQADHVVITGLSQEGTDTTAGTFAIPNLNLNAQFASACP